MALVTLCPSCKTTFLVTPVQLKVHSGDVRCGQCHHIFNSFATLITVEESEISYSSKVGGAESLEDKIDETIPDSENNLASSPDAATSAASNLTQEAILSNLEDNFDAVEAHKHSRWWIVANLVLLFVLMGQITYFYRTEISVVTPGARLILEKYCAIFNCTVPYPQDITQFSIESSDLQASLADHPRITTMTATIHNHASFPQELPALKLSLTDIQDQLLASRIFTADDYFGEINNLVHIIEPNHEIDIRIDFENGEVNATGYRLLLLHLQQ